MDNKTFRLALLLYAILLIALLGLLVTSEFKEEKLQKQDVEELTNISTFYTVESCVNKYILYLSSKDYDSIYKLLDDNYIEKNKVTKDNIEDKIEVLDNNYTFTTTNIYRNKKQDIFYVKGVLTSVTITEDSSNKETKKEFITTIKLDTMNKKFSVIPDGDGGVVYE